MPRKKTPEIIELFLEFLYLVQGMTLREIAEFTGMYFTTVQRIAKRRAFTKKHKIPQSIDESIPLLEDSLQTSLQRTNKFLTDELMLDEDNIHRHIMSQKNMADIRQSLVDGSVYHSLKVAMEGLKKCEQWIQSTKALPEDTKTKGLLCINAYRQYEAGIANNILKTFTK